MLDDQFDDELRPRYTLEDALAALDINLDEEIIPPQVVMGLSDLSEAQVNQQLLPVWETLSNDQRATIMERLAEASEADFVLDFSAVAHVGYRDEYQAVRRAAVQAGWTDESVENLRALMELVRTDPTAEVRAQAMLQLGEFIYSGEVGDLNPEDTFSAEELALDVLDNPDEVVDVQRRALEAIAHTSRDGISARIEQAYQHEDQNMRISAVAAMGNSCDAQWGSTILAEMDSDISEMRFESVRAAGALGLRESLERLIDFGHDADRQIQEAAIWSIGEIGGDEAIQALHNLEAEYGDDDELAEAIDEALSMATIMSEMEDFDLMAFVDDDDFDEDDAIIAELLDDEE